MYLRYKNIKINSKDMKLYIGRYVQNSDISVTRKLILL